MNKSQQVVADAIKKLRDQFFSTFDDAVFARWTGNLYSDLGIKPDHFQAVTGVDKSHIENKRNVGGAVLARRHNSFDDYPQQFRDLMPLYEDKSLTREEHGKDDWVEPDLLEWAKKECPVRFREKALVDYVNATPAQRGLVELAYQEILGRTPDGPGWEHYKNMLSEGVPRWQVVQYIELSPEAIARNK